MSEVLENPAVKSYVLRKDLEDFMQKVDLQHIQSVEIDSPTTVRWEVSVVPASALPALRPEGLREYNTCKLAFLHVLHYAHTCQRNLHLHVNLHVTCEMHVNLHLKLVNFSKIPPKIG